MNWLPTKEGFEQCTATNVFKFFGNSAPPYVSEIFSPVGQGWITRRSKSKLNLPFRKTNTGHNGLSYIGPKIWNILKSSNNVNSFKHKIKDKFFNDLQNGENSPYCCEATTYSCAAASLGEIDSPCLYVFLSVFNNFAVTSVSGY